MVRLEVEKKGVVGVWLFGHRDCDGVAPLDSVAAAANGVWGIEPRNMSIGVTVAWRRLSHFVGRDRIGRSGVSFGVTVETDSVSFGRYLNFIAAPPFARYEEMQKTIGTGGAHNVLHGSSDLRASDADEFGGAHFVHVDEAILRSDHSVIVLVEVGSHDTAVEADVDFALHGEELALLFPFVGDDVAGAVDTAGQETGRV